MIRTRAFAVLMLSLTLVGCGNLQLVRLAELPVPMQALGVEISEERPTKESVMPRSFEVPGKSAFVQQTSGGSLAVGLLLGPLGVLANVANIDRITREMGEAGSASGLFSIDAKAEAAQAIGGRVSGSEPSTSSQNRTSLKPFLVYFVADEKIGVDVIVQIRAETEISRDGKPAKLTATYASYLRETLPIEALRAPMTSEKLDSLRANIRKAYDDLYVEMLIDMKQPAPTRKIAWVKSRVLGIGAPGDIDKTSSGHFVIRTRYTEDRYGLMVFESDSQYEFDNGPVVREKRQ